MAATFILLTLRSGPPADLDLEGFSPGRLAELDEQAIGRLPLWAGGRQVPLGDVFDIRGDRSDRVRLEGDLGAVIGIGAGMDGGELIVDGDAGDRAGAGMRGGHLHVLGSIGNDAGSAMAGGVLRVTGNAGDRLGAAAPGAAKGMTGGEIIVGGSAGAEAGARARRGLIVVGGDTGDDAARAMIAGSLIVLGRTGRNPGRGNKRGSIVAAGALEVPATYRYACTFKPPHLRLTFAYLQRQYGVAVEDRLFDGTWRRYCGDIGDPGKGEILVLSRGVGL